jgi:hypothetical protein
MTKPDQVVTKLEGSDLPCTDLDARDEPQDPNAAPEQAIRHPNP